MALSDDLQKLKLDKRMNQWNLAQKKVTQEEIQKNLDSLEDLSDQAQPMISKEENEIATSSEE